MRHLRRPSPLATLALGVLAACGTAAPAGSPDFSGLQTRDLSEAIGADDMSASALDMAGADLARPGDLARAALGKTTDLARPDLAVARDMTVLDLSMPDLQTPPDLSMPDLRLACAPVINEVQTSGAVASDEFIEVLNPCNDPVDVTGWKLVYRSSANVNPPQPPDTSTLYTFKAPIPAKGRVVLCSDYYVGDAGVRAGCLDVLGGSSLADNSSVGLRDALGALVDSVGYGAINAGNTFIEKAAAPVPSAGKSVQRTPDGTDTQENSIDFKVAASTLGAPSP